MKKPSRVGTREGSGDEVIRRHLSRSTYIGHQPYILRSDSGKTSFPVNCYKRRCAMKCPIFRPVHVCKYRRRRFGRWENVREHCRSHPKR